MCERRQFAAKLGRMAREGHAGITGGGEDLEICYAQSAKMPDGAEDAQIGDIRDAYLRQLRKSADIDVMRMSTTCGPHKDDLLFRLDGRNIRVYGSQGQQRTAALALKIAQVGVMREETGHLPVLLLDDVMSELDSARQAHIPLSTWDAQAIITCTGRESAPAFGRPVAGGDAELGESDKSGESANGTDSDGGAEEAGEAGGAREAEEAGHGGRVYFFVSGGTVRREC
jgi:DNA replication and repair protein RecF